MTSIPSSQSKVIIISSPSGGGKTTIMHRLMAHVPELEFSISACSRLPRKGEQNGKDYYFMSEQEFLKKIEAGEFLEWEEVYPGKFYGTLKSEIHRIWDVGHYVIFDVDVVGGCSLKTYFKQQALSIFIMPPDLNILRERLLLRGTESLESIDMRLSRAEYELSFANQYDVIVLNDSVETALIHTLQFVKTFLEYK